MSEGYWDIHNHILPGVDDGSCSMEETYQLLEAEYGQGIRNIVFTPHYRLNMFSVPPSDREEVYKDVFRTMRREFPHMQFHLGCEYHVHDGMLENLYDVRCRMAGTKIVLEEFSSVSHFEDMKRTVAGTLNAGFRPVLAHVERCRCLLRDEENVSQLKKMGALVQINADAVLGKNGMAPKRFCYHLLARDLVDFVASDAHDMKRRPVRMKACMDKIRKKFGAEQAERIFKDRPARAFGRKK